ncbi:hypothetical protein ANO14919_075550 [Xylariales sp. No.14919]|nr:hypothetical protein ANO14919_075550 [Xylariales sp. No.14919]
MSSSCVSLSNSARNGLTAELSGSMNGAVNSQPGTTPIAIIGMGCRFPGDASSPEKLWELLANGRSTWTEIPPDRFNKDAFYHPQADHLGTTNVIGGHFLNEDIAAWDASFFNFTAEAAKATDPQLRILLETTFEALENAGLSMESIARSDTSVYAGEFTKDYYDSFLKDGDSIPRYFTTGSEMTMISNRISHFFDLRGPSVSIDTGCSTALVGLHLGCQSIRSGESKISIVGGTNLMINPDRFISESNLGFLGTTGKCFSFDSRAEGYGRGEGIATLIVKSLEGALTDGDPIRAVIRETALNQDGKTPTITSPSQESQEEIISMCYRKAGLDPLETNYVEAHGTGTRTGDPVEASAIGKVFGKKRSLENPLLVGSVKTNIGHLEAASGLASVIKLAMAIERGQIPPNINFETPNPDIDLDQLKLKVPTQLEAWPAGQVRRGSVSNFGYGGTNSHVIMEDPRHLEELFRSKLSGHSPPNGHKTGDMNGLPVTNCVATISNIDAVKSPKSRVYVLSAHTEGACLSRIQQLRKYLETPTDLPVELGDLAFTLSEKRTQFPWRVALSADTATALAEGLSDSALRPKHVAAPPRLGFVFTGQGAQWHAMGRELIAAYPAFAAAVHGADGYLRSLGASWSLLDELTRDDRSTKVDQPEFSFPLCVALQVCLVELLRGWGIKPAAVTGHSSGEISAAFAAGAINMREALEVAYIRGVLTQEHVSTAKVRGAMLAVALGPAEVRPYVENTAPRKVVVACINSPSSVTLSGDADGIRELKFKLNGDNIFARQLKVEAAYHSHHMNSIADRYRAALDKGLGDGEHNRHPLDDILFYSPVSGKRVRNAADLGAGHWVENMVQPVLFSACLRNMILPAESDALPVDVLVEIGPHGALAGPVRQTLALPELKDSDVVYTTCLTRGKNSVQTAHEMVCMLVERGYPIDLKEVNFPDADIEPRVLRDLPTYPWNRSVQHWSEPYSNTQFRIREHPPHDLLGVRAKESNPLAPIWRHGIRPSEIPWVRDHIIDSAIVYPAAGCIAMAIEAIRQYHSGSDMGTISEYELRDVEILRAVVIPDSTTGTELQLSLRGCSDKSFNALHSKEFSICSHSPLNGWIEHCKGLISVMFDSKTDGASTWSSVSHAAGNRPGEPFVASRRITPEQLFGELHDVGVKHGPAFQNLVEIKAGRGQSYGTFRIANTKSLMPGHYERDHVIHPVTLDAVFQLAYPALSKGESKLAGSAIPRSIKTMNLSASIVKTPGHLFQNYTRLLRQDSRGFDVELVTMNAPDDVDTLPILRVSGMHFESLGLSADANQVHDSADSSLYMKMEWREDLTLLPPGSLNKMLSFEPDEADAVLIRDLRKAAYIYIHEAIQSLTDTEVKGLDRHFKSLYTWMGSQKTKAEWSEAPLGTKEALFEKIRTAGATGLLLTRIGENLAAIMRKTMDVTNIVMKSNSLYSFYESDLGYKRSLSQMGKLLELFAHKNPCAKVLEIGAGTGVCTAAALRAFGREGSASFASYDFTDTSEDRLNEAKQRFGSWGDLVRYETLDIERDPSAQGFGPASYDLIISAQCLHAAKSAESALLNIRKLLRPEGKLILIETTRESIDLQLVLRALPEWQPNHEPAPVLGIEAWNDLLIAAGFTELDVRARDFEDDAYSTYSVMMSTADRVLSRSTAYPCISIIYGGASPPKPWLESLAGKVLELTSRRPIVSELHELNTSNSFCIFVGEAEQTFLDTMNNSDWAAVKKLLLDSSGVLWISRGAAYESDRPMAALHSGLLRTLRQEDNSKLLVSLDLDLQSEPWTDECVNTIARILNQVSLDRQDGKDSRDFEFALRNGAVLIPRVQQVTALNHSEASVPTPELKPFIQPGRELCLEVGTEGLLDTLRFVDMPGQGDLSTDYVEIEPKAFGLNFRDIMVSMGQMHPRILGFECSGIITRVGSQSENLHNLKPGDRVAAYTFTGGWRNHIRVPWNNVGKIPDSMPWEAAASVPMIWVTAYFALVDVSRLRRGETVLIHSATGGVGQAAVILAQRLIGANILCTVGSEEKRDFVMQNYGILPECIFSSRNTSFQHGVMARTGGKGVDVVLNSLAGPLLDASWKCVAPHGRFVEIGKRDIQDGKSLPMEVFQRAVSFSAIDVHQLAQNKGHVYSETLQKVLGLLGDGTLPPVTPITTYPLSEIRSAFRAVQAGKHRGKIVILPRPDNLVPVMPRQRRVQLSPRHTYLITGGIRGLGQSIAQWAVDKGGCRVELCNCDIGSFPSLTETLGRLEHDMPPIRGIIQGAAALEDSVLENMTLEQWDRALHPKVQGTLNLQRWVTEHTKDNLDFFVILSSIVGVAGNTSQANYGAGGAFQDALARHLRGKNIPAVSIDLAAVRSLGIAARTDGAIDHIVRHGHRVIEEHHVLQVLEYAVLNLKRKAHGDTMGQIIAGLGSFSDASNYSWQADARFLRLKDNPRSVLGGAHRETAKESSALHVQLGYTSSSADRVVLIVSALSRKLAEICMVDENTIDASLPLSRYGVDSLVAVELRNWLVTATKTDVSLFDLLQSASLTILAQAIVEKVVAGANG